MSSYDLSARHASIAISDKDFNTYKNTITENAILLLSSVIILHLGVSFETLRNFYCLQ